MNDLLRYLDTHDQRKVTIGFIEDGRKVRMYRKIDGSDHERIKGAIGELRKQGKTNVLAEVYRRNGTAEVISKIFQIDSTQLGELPTWRPFTIQPTWQAPKQPTLLQRPTPQPPTSTDMEGWKDYALKTEQDKVRKLDAELKQLQQENKQLDGKVRDFEKEMIRKDHEIEKLTSSMQSKSGLSGFVEKASENPAFMNLLAGIATRAMGLPAEPGQLPTGSPELTNTQTEQYLTNIRTWLYKQPLELQDSFYQLIHELSYSRDLAGSIVTLTDYLKRGKEAKLSVN